MFWLCVAVDDYSIVFGVRVRSSINRLSAFLTKYNVLAFFFDSSPVLVMATPPSVKCEAERNSVCGRERDREEHGSVCLFSLLLFNAAPLPTAVECEKILSSGSGCMYHMHSRLCRQRVNAATLFFLFISTQIVSLFIRVEGTSVAS